MTIPESITIATNTTATLVLSQNSLSFAINSGTTASNLPPTASVAGIQRRPAVAKLPGERRLAMADRYAGGWDYSDDSGQPRHSSSQFRSPFAGTRNLHGNACCPLPRSQPLCRVFAEHQREPERRGPACRTNIHYVARVLLDHQWRNPAVASVDSHPELWWWDTDRHHREPAVHRHLVFGYRSALSLASSSAAGGAQLTVSLNSNNLSAGYYTSIVTIASSGGSVTVPVTLQIAPNVLTTTQTGSSFSMTAGTLPSIFQSSIGVSSTTAASWTAQAVTGTWLSVLSPSGNTSGTSNLNFGLSAAATSLAPGTYYDTIQLSSNSVSNSPVSFIVTLTVNPVSAPVLAFPSPTSLLFITSVGSDPASQSVTVGVNSPTPVTYQASTSVTSPTGGTWLSLAPSSATGTASSGTPATSTINATSAGLAAGVYQGQIGYQTSSGVPQSVSAFLAVFAAGVPLPAGTVTHLRPGSPAPPVSTDGATCTPTKLYVVPSGLVGNFQLTSGLPAPLSVTVFNDCAAFVSNAAVSVTFSDGDSPIALSSAAQSSTSGIYSGTWTPTLASQQLAVVATASLTGLTSGTATVTGTVLPSTNPILTSHSTTNVYSAAIGGGIAPGTIVMMYGTNFAKTATVAKTLPLPTTLGGVSVTIGGIAAPLYYTGPTQINAQVPPTLLPGTYNVVVNSGGQLTSPDTIQVTAVSPGVGATTTGYALAQDASSGYSVITEAAPAKPGDYVALYLSGLGATNITVAAGAASPSNPAAIASVQPTLTLNGTNVPIAFAGLTPTLSGLYQINFQVPASTPNGDLKLVVTQSGVSSSSVILPVHN